MVYDAALVAANGQLKDPSTLNQQVRLDHEGRMQCTSCHDPHNNRFPKFMVMDDRAGQLCISCHNVDNWASSIHATSTKTWNGVGPNPWPHTRHTTVADNACESCHAPHAAGTPERLLTFSVEEQNCYSCHSGTVAAKNIASEFNKFSAHPIIDTSGVHDPMEDTVNPVRHVECADCHNPHEARTSAATVPNASGALAGVRGVNSAGAVVDRITREYELCFRCHADSVARGPARVNRQYVQTNTRLEFSSSNPSYHPVLAPGKNANVPSLLSPWTATSLMYCTDCHNNNQGPNTPGGTGPNGPHGSIYEPILERNLLLTDNSGESAANYALCYKCHSRSVVTSEQDSSWKYHKKHVVEKRTACTTCHDPHGVVQNAHLINFNTSYVSPNGGVISFNDGTIGNRSCTLTCHGKAHNTGMRY
jgi:predicted CXXCH cytochrome family protein